MKLYEYLNQMDASDELTCWDNIFDSEFYFYKNMYASKEDIKEYPNLKKCMDYLIVNLEIKGIDKNGVWVNLYELLDNPQIIEYAKAHLYSDEQYESDDDVVELLFDDMVGNINNGHEEFCEEMMKCFSNLKQQSDELDKTELKIVIATMKGKTKEFLEKMYSFDKTQKEYQQFNSMATRNEIIIDKLEKQLKKV